MKVNLTVLALNGGEADKQTLARADLDIYSRLAETMENAFPYTNGGVSKAPGSKFLDDVALTLTDEAGAAILDEDGVTSILTEADGIGILRSFVRSGDIAYALELSANLIRFIDNATATYVTITGAAATIGAFSDESAAPSTGGAAPITGGTSDVSDPFYIDITDFVIDSRGGGNVP